MSVKNEVQCNQSKTREAFQLTQCEWLVIKMFRQLDEQGRKDIIRFLDALLAAR
ncbi:hypothetical protein C163_16590 [Pseudomonas sp. FGI182]|nr:hypothetical protein C163_16590 [Pseudomonas sp. FGI182]